METINTSFHALASGYVDGLEGDILVRQVLGADRSLFLVYESQDPL